MAEFSFNDVIDTINRVNDAKAVSLPQFTRPAIIESPNFMQASLVEEPIVNDIIKNLYNIYIGYILVALQMNDLVVGNRRVRDVLGTVSTGSILTNSTESFVDRSVLTNGLTAGCESLDDFNKAKGHQVTGGGRIAEISHKDAAPIASGRQIEVKFATENGKEPITVMINVKFNTRLIPDQLVEQIIGMNFDLSLSKRYLQMQAGEISFVKDFILNLDKLERREKALKLDKGNIIKDIFRHQNHASFRQLFKLAVSNNHSYNLANSVLMLDDATATKYAKKVGFNFDNVRDRARFFASTYNLFIVLVDSQYSRVTLYINGIDQSASFSFNELKSSSSSDKMGLKEIMEYLNKSQMPKF